MLTQPIRNIVPNLVYAGSGHEVKIVMAVCKALLREGRVLTANEHALRAEAQVQAEAVARRGMATLCTRGWHCWRRWKRDSCERLSGRECEHCQISLKPV